MPCRRWNSKPVGVAGHLEDGRDGQRVVGGELRIEARPRGEQALGAGEIGLVGRGLAGEHRIVGEAALLRALDLGVPIGALDQAHHHPPVERAGELADPVDDRRGALLVGLHGEAEAVPAGERRIGERPRAITSSDSSSRSASSASTVRSRSCASPRGRGRGAAAPAPSARARASPPRSAGGAPTA